MKKREKRKLLTLLLAAAIYCTVPVFADTEGELLLMTESPQSASITVDTATVPTASFNTETGTMSGLSTIFKLETNGDDDNFDFVITSSLTYDGGSESAYDSDGNILFANTSANEMPTAEAVNEAKNKTGTNYNIISFPVTVTTDSPFTSNYHAGYGVYGNSYVIRVNGGTEGKITHTIGATPVTNTYNITRDAAGTYQATVTFSAIAK